MADAEKASEVQNGPSQSKLVLAKPRLGGFGSGGFVKPDTINTSSNIFGKIGSSSVLRPSQLKPAVTVNPFLRVSIENKMESSKEDLCPENRLNEPKEENEPKDGVDPPKFVPLGGATSVKSSNPVPAPTQPGSSSTSSGFVFGQNLSERAMVAEGINNGGTGVDHSSTNGNSELLFSSAVASKVETNQEDGGGVAGEGLAAAAAEYEQSHARQPVLTSATTTTGEEDETNVLQITCRLFAWEAGSWRERGRGALRLNEGGARGARLVCRALGSLRVVLNTKLWPGMVAERAGARSLRITASDVHNQVKVFLVMATPADIVHLHRELTSRIALSTGHKTSAESASPCVTEHHPHDSYVDEESLGGSNDELAIGTEENGKEDVREDEGETEQKDATDSNDDEMKEENKTLKRKEAELEEIASKRQCPEIVIE